MKVLSKFTIDIPVIGLAKRLEEIFLPGIKFSVRIKYASPALQLLQSIRDEAHRFAISYQKKKRKIKNSPVSAQDEIHR
jgi:excinuclease ABC subunit C